jgi:hypothetical protein
MLQLLSERGNREVGALLGAPEPENSGPSLLGPVKRQHSKGFSCPASRQQAQPAEAQLCANTIALFEICPVSPPIRTWP